MVDKKKTEEYGNRKVIEFRENKLKAIIVDIDGTMSLGGGRDPYDYAASIDDRVDHRLKHLVRNLIEHTNYHIIFMTGRPNTIENEQVTRQWLNEKVYEWNLVVKGGLRDSSWSLLMRPRDCNYPDDVVKKHIYETRIKPYMDVVCVFEDRDCCVEMWRELGILCCQVYKGDF